MLFPRIPSRPVRYALIATHAFRDAISDVEVDFTRAEQAIADRLDALTTKVDALMDRLAAYEDSIDDDVKEAAKPKAKTKAKHDDEVVTTSKARPRAKRAAKK